MCANHTDFPKPTPAAEFTHAKRTRIERLDDVLTMDGKAVRVVMTPHKICVGCLDITTEAATWLFCEHARRFQAQTVQMAEGETSHPC